MFNFTRNCQTVFQSSCAIFLSHQPCSSCCPSSPTLGIDRLLSFSHSGFNLIFLVTDDVEHLFMCSFAIHRSSLVMCLLKYLAHFVLLSCLSCYYGVIKVLYIFWRQFFYLIYVLRIFSPSLWCGFSLSQQCLLKRAGF